MENNKNILEKVKTKLAISNFEKEEMNKSMSKTKILQVNCKKII